MYYEIFNKLAIYIFRCFKFDMHIKSIKNVRLPYQEIKGSFEYRQNKAEQFTHKVIQEISPAIDMEGVSLSKLGRLLKKALPKNLAFFIKKHKSLDSAAELTYIYTKDDYLSKMYIEFKTDGNGKINRSQIPTITHEIRHLADLLYHPKFLVREQSVVRKKLDTAKRIAFYYDNIYIQETYNGKKDKKQIINIIRHQITKMLRGLNTENKIDILQNIRYNLISERNAFQDGYKRAKKLYKKFVPVYEDTLNYPSNGYMFNEKIKLIQDMSFELINKERKIHKAKLKNKKH